MLLPVGPVGLRDQGLDLPCPEVDYPHLGTGAGSPAKVVDDLRVVGGPARKFPLDDEGEGLRRDAHCVQGPRGGGRLREAGEGDYVRRVPPVESLEVLEQTGNQGERKKSRGF